MSDNGHILKGQWLSYQSNKDIRASYQTPQIWTFVFIHVFILTWELLCNVMYSAYLVSLSESLVLLCTSMYRAK